MEAPRINGEVVVVGASMAGLLTAGVLANHFVRVALVERDRLPDGPAFRKGVPQSRHLHALPAHGLGALARLFPGLEDELVAAGAATVEWPGEVRWLSPNDWASRVTGSFRILSLSRELLESHVRRRLMALPNVRFLEGYDAVDLLPGRGNREVVGIRLCPRPSTRDTREVQEMPAALVVDASGRGSRAPGWLADLGYQPPAETVVDPCLGYASRQYAIPAGFAAAWRLLVLRAQPPHETRGAVLSPLEGDRWQLTLSGFGGDYPPTDDAGFLAFVRSLPSPLFSEAIAGAKSLTPIFGYRRTENRRRHYERLDRLPERFLVTGDAACVFNPIYGQGMTVAAHTALALDQSLRERRGVGGNLMGLSTDFQRRAAECAERDWLVATSADLRYPITSRHSTTEDGAPGAWTYTTTPPGRSATPRTASDPGRSWWRPWRRG